MVTGRLRRNKLKLESQDLALGKKATKSRAPRMNLYHFRRLNQKKENIWGIYRNKPDWRSNVGI